MLTIKHYKRPIAAISITGERSRITPAVLSRFLKPLAENKIQIYSISNGEKEVLLFIDEAECDKAIIYLTEEATNSSFESIAVRRGLGMISVNGPELVTTPGLLNKLTTPLAKQKINIVAVTSSFDTIIFFFDLKDAEKVFRFWENYVPEKISIFRKAREKLGRVIEKIIHKK
ncbi:MAG: ACT domain-containing protein [Candidatus Micrarchaeota archaeon]|nr:ACT domain-containing protein [Candidatus Micrarchaeota archaeon]